ncbi:heme A synthase [Lentibacillus kapialis]|uniref:Heme A synthase n=1 Tax=Lentibacillus kapialis TaxID=340214 RepID=A0A917PMH2_9BACI|nr:COX15/CtaA family protein [Lentibacillus kapialis]GGJ85066.1 heme A synthase [Lentibacillus kapialis]
MSKRHVACITMILTYFLIVFGGYVASSESGMGCGPDWPLCNGKVIPQLEGDTLIEFGHRVIGALLFIMTLFLFVKVKRENDSNLMQKAANWMMALLSLQLIMGAVVVFYHLPSIIITLHLLIALIFMALLIWFWRHDREFTAKNRHDAVTSHLNTIIILLFVTIGLGAYLKHEEFGLSCGWLACTENAFLPATMPQLLQTGHRLLALLVTGYIIFLTYKAYKTNESILKKRMLLSFAIVIAQVVTGVFTILSSVSLPMAVLHLTVGTLLFAILVEARMVYR